jgi:hypothetical protein
MVCPKNDQTLRNNMRSLTEKRKPQREAEGVAWDKSYI